MTDKPGKAAGPDRRAAGVRGALNVLLLSDGLPGHGNQARGLVHWMQSRYSVRCTELHVRLRVRPLARLLMPWLLRLGHPGCSLLTRFYQYALPFGQVPDLIVSAGGNTSFLNVALARVWGIPNIFLGSKRRLRSNDFSAHLTLEPTGEPHNIVMDLVPTTIDSEAMATAGAALRQQLGHPESIPLYAVICGGDGAGYQYRENDWQLLARQLNNLATQHNARLLLTTSRRSGSVAERVLKAGIDAGNLADAVWWNEQPRKVMNAYLGAADAIFVTADSMSMINESISAQKPVMLLELTSALPDQRYRDALDRFVAQTWCERSFIGSDALMIPKGCTDLARAQSVLLDALELNVAFG